STSDGTNTNSPTATVRLALRQYQRGRTAAQIFRLAELLSHLNAQTLARKLLSRAFDHRTVFGLDRLRASRRSVERRMVFHIQDTSDPASSDVFADESANVRSANYACAHVEQWRWNRHL